MKLQRLFSLLTLLLVLYVQYGAVVHAAEHQFHQFEESCDLYKAAERLSDTTLQSSSAVLVNIPDFFFYTASVQHLYDHKKPLPQSRSPPSIFS